MRALRQDVVHTGQEILTATEYRDLAIKNPTTLYIVGDVDNTGADPVVNISDVRVGNTAQLVLVDNTDAIAWVATGITGHTNVGVNLTALV